MNSRILNKQELINISAGNIRVTPSLINALMDVINIILDLGQKTGSGIRRLVDGDVCSTR